MASFSTSEEGGVLVITLEDPAALNDFRSNDFRDALYAIVEQRSRPLVAFDLSATDYLASCGIAILVSLKRRVEGHEGKLVLVRVHPNVRNVLVNVMKLSPFFQFADDLPAAIAILRSSPPA